MNEAKPHGRKPVLQSLLVADSVYKDEVTGKHIVAGIFNSMYFARPSKPKEEGAAPITEKEGVSTDTSVLRGFRPWHRSGTPFAYINLTEVKGEQCFSLRCVSLNDNKAYFKIDFRVKCEDPLKNIETAISIPSLPEATGIFAVELLWNDMEILGSMRITIQEIALEA